MQAHIVHLDPQQAPSTLMLECAFSLKHRLCGLLGKAPLLQAQGLWIRPCNSVHSCFMGFAIDVLYLNRQQQVVGIRSNLRPWRFSLCRKAYSVVELAAGEAQRLNIHLGDRLACDC